MPPLTTDLLPAALAAQLTPEQLQTLAETERDKRLAVLATALGLTEPVALTTLASAAGVDIASNLEPDPESRGLLPARLVHDMRGEAGGMRSEAVPP